MEAIMMPALGQTTDEMHIQEWLVQEGETVEMGQPLLRVETDKAQLDVECVADGVLLKIVCAADETVTAGTTIAYVGEPGEIAPGR